MILAGATAIEGLAAGAGLFYNGTSLSNLRSVPCFDIMEEFIDCADPTGCGLGNDAKAWNYQVRTFHLDDIAKVVVQGRVFKLLIALAFYDSVFRLTFWLISQCPNFLETIVPKALKKCALNFVSIRY